MIAALAEDTGRYGLSIMETDGVSASINRWIKTAEMFSAVNLTLGLPFIRTSPDHGTAYDLAGKGRGRIAA